MKIKHFIVRIALVLLLTSFTLPMWPKGARAAVPPQWGAAQILMQAGDRLLGDSPSKGYIRQDNTTTLEIMLNKQAFDYLDKVAIKKQGATGSIYFSKSDLVRNINGIGRKVITIPCVNPDEPSPGVCYSFDLSLDSFLPNPEGSYYAEIQPVNGQPSDYKKSNDVQLSKSAPSSDPDEAFFDIINVNMKTMRNSIRALYPPDAHPEFWTNEHTQWKAFWDNVKRDLLPQVIDVVLLGLLPEDNSFYAEGWSPTVDGYNVLIQIKNNIKNIGNRMNDLVATGRYPDDKDITKYNILYRYWNSELDETPGKKKIFQTFGELKTKTQSMIEMAEKLEEAATEPISDGEKGQCMGKEGLQPEEGGINILGFIACLINMVADQILKLAVSWMATFAGI